MLLYSLVSSKCLGNGGWGNMIADHLPIADIIII